MILRTALTTLVGRPLATLVLMLALAWGAAVAPAGAEPVVLLGLYPPGSLQLQSVVNTIIEVDTWLAPTGKQVTIAGDFMDMELFPEFNVPAELNGAWNNGYVPFVNLAISHTTQVINSGAIDSGIHKWARAFAIWSQGGQKRAFIALMQEMNGYWTIYNGDPPGFIAAYRRVRQIFEQELAAAHPPVPLTAISWVFAPNGWSLPGHEFEKYYPGRDVVDIVSFSAYNYGACPGDFPWVHWDTYDVALKPHLDRMRAMAPTKPIFIAETGVVHAPVHGVGDKNQWLFDTFTQLAAYPGFRGIIYFNLVQTEPNLPACKPVDYRLHVPGTNLWQGFWNAMATIPNYVSWAPDSPEMQHIVFGREPAQIFADVPTIHPFALEAGQADLAPWIHALYAAGVTGGCSTNPLQYCPNAGITRGQMAVFLLRGMHGGSYSPPHVLTTRFGDVPAGPAGHPFADWIEAFAGAGITGGCNAIPLLYCPDQTVTRGQMAVFILKAMFGIGYTPPAAKGIFGDVPTSHPFAAWIESLAAHGITGGCGGGNYCPASAVTRAQMAIFLVRAFHLPM